ncbi:hypothetical protein COO60DRAFT_1638236 [Scenedesmus sp. NREL 46B-D3]|nr:hypothetical protein COO60DRAFT_1638236 [Scenedesmus sp. NREL 46B-D3]
MALLGPEGPEGARLLHVLLSQHAALLVPGLLASFNSTQDLGVSLALQDAALMMSSCAPDYLPELFTEHAAAAAGGCAWASGAMLASALQACPELGAEMAAGLTCGLEAIVVPLLHTFSLLAANSSSPVALQAGSQGSPPCLPAGLVQQLFAGLLQLLPDLAAGELRQLALQLLLRLAETGCAVESATQLPTAAAPPLGSQQAVHAHSSTHSQQQYSQQQQQQQYNQQQQQQQQQQPDLASSLMAALKPVLLDEEHQSLAAAGAFEAAAEGLQAAAVAGLRCLASQGPAFMQHFHFGVDTLTELLQHCTASCNTPVMAATLLLLEGPTDPNNRSSLLVPLASLVRLAAAAVAVLPDGEQAGQQQQQQQQQQGMELQPGPELQVAYEAACSVLTHITLKWASSSSSNWAALQPHILAGAHKALAAISLLSSRSLAGGFLVGSCKLVGAAVQILTSVLEASGSNGAACGAGTQEQQQQQQQQRGSTMGKAGSSAQQKGSKKKQSGQAKAVAVALEDKPFAKRRQQQRQLQLVQGDAASQGSAGGGAATVAAADDVLAVLEAVLQHALPAAARVLPAAAEEAAEAQQRLPAGQQQQQLGMFCGLLHAVQQLLLALLSSGDSSAEIAPFMELFARRLLGPSLRWASTAWGILETLALPAAAVGDVWQLLLAAAMQLEGQPFMLGSSPPNITALAAALSSKASSRIALLELLCSAAAHPPGPAHNTAPHQQHHQRGATAAAAAAAAAATADIRRFSQWIVAHAAQLPGAARLLLQRWLATLLPACTNTNAAAAIAPAAAAAAAGGGAAVPSNSTAAGMGRQCRRQQQLQQQLLLLGPGGVLELCKRSLLAAAGSIGSSWGSSLVVWACNSCLLTATGAVAAAAAGPAEEGAGSGAAASDTLAGGLPQQLLQYGIQQVHMTATCVVQLPPAHPLLQQLQMAAANAANALLHTALMQQQDAALLQLLAESHELNQLMVQLAAAALGGSSCSSSASVQLLPAPTAADLEGCSSSHSRALPVEQAFLQGGGSSRMQAAAAAAAAGQADIAYGHAALADTSQEAVAVYGLSAAQLLVLSHGCGGGLLRLLLLDSVRLLLLQRTAQQHIGMDFMQQSRLQQPWHWQEPLAVLQNAVVTAGTSTSTLLAEAAAGCLAVLYTAAATDMHAAAAAAAARETSDDEEDDRGSAAAAAAAGSSARVVARSAWNKQVLRALLQRLCQGAVGVRAAAQQAQQAGAGSSCAPPGGMCSWLCDGDCQQQCQAWCCDAQLLLGYMQLLHAAEEPATTAGDAAAGQASGGRQQLAAGLQLLTPLLEQQQLVPFLCWAAARSSWVEDCVAASSDASRGSFTNAAQQSWQQQQWQQQEEHSVAVAAAAAATAAVGSVPAAAAAAAAAGSSCSRGVRAPVVVQQQAR